MKKRVFERSKTFKKFPIVLNSETENGFLSVEKLFGFRVRYYRKLFKGFKPLDNVFSIQKSSKGFSYIDSEIYLGLQTFESLFSRFPRRQKYFRDEKIIPFMMKILPYRCYSETNKW
jgi:hypothetical protein